LASSLISGFHSISYFKTDDKGVLLSEGTFYEELIILVTGSSFCFHFFIIIQFEPLIIIFPLLFFFIKFSFDYLWSRSSKSNGTL